MLAAMVNLQFHDHIRRRMAARGVLESEVLAALETGWPCDDAQSGTDCRTMVFEFRAEWEGRWFEEKEVTVYFKDVEDSFILLTAKARYGSNFPRRSP